MATFFRGCFQDEAVSPGCPQMDAASPPKMLVRVGQWNHYYIRAVKGEVRLWVNGEMVSGGEGMILGATGLAWNRRVLRSSVRDFGSVSFLGFANCEVEFGVK
ncbi:MAG: family 16 glycoside hydrolase [Pirellulales bacterium]